MSEQYDGLKKEIKTRYFDRSKECVDTDNNEKLLRTQGAARELGELLDMIELIENPVEEK